jgi:hypothetical protein
METMMDATTHNTIDGTIDSATYHAIDNTIDDAYQLLNYPTSLCPFFLIGLKIIARYIILSF